MVQITVPTQKEWIRHARQGFDHRVGHCEVLHMFVECMGGNAYTLIGDPADVETIQSMYSYITSHHAKTEGESMGRAYCLGHV
jgi:hypothetical protein